jgi:hypothetical protein
MDYNYLFELILDAAFCDKERNYLFQYTHIRNLIRVQYMPWYVLGGGACQFKCKNYIFECLKIMYLALVQG